MIEQTICIDWSHGKDFTGVTSICPKCREVLYMQIFHDTMNEIAVKVFKNCPNCGCKFDSCKVIE